ncbi:hypothetical protein [Leclercia tamurae]|uniref:hypothetical protein n=1 Tax=Leclercia tamurae TaxID=2926467 RepID=UPI0036F467A1
MSPLMIDSADFSHKLGLVSRNVEHTEAFLARGTTDFHLPGFVLPVGYRLLKSLYSDEYRIVTTDEGKPYTAYAVKLEFHNEITFLHGAATQVMVWRTPRTLHQSVVSGFPQLFFQWLLSEYNVVVSDSEQTGDGQRFWLRMIDWAFTMNYQISVADGTVGEEWHLTPVNSYAELEERWITFAWGYDRDVHPHRRLVISKK